MPATRTHRSATGSRKREKDGSSLDPELRQILPHRPPMVMIDSLERFDDQTAEALKTFSRGDYGLDDNGRVAEPMLIECLAQTVAAGLGSLARMQGQEPAEGMLVGVSGLEFLRPVRQGRALALNTRITHRVGRFVVVEATVRSGDELIARGELKLYIGSGPSRG